MDLGVSRVVANPRHSYGYGCGLRLAAHPNPHSAHLAPRSQTRSERTITQIKFALASPPSRSGATAGRSYARAGAIIERRRTHAGSRVTAVGRSCIRLGAAAMRPGTKFGRMVAGAFSETGPRIIGWPPAWMLTPTAAPATTVITERKRRFPVIRVGINRVAVVCRSGIGGSRASHLGSAAAKKHQTRQSQGQCDARGIANCHFRCSPERCVTREHVANWKPTLHEMTIPHSATRQRPA